MKKLQQIKFTSHPSFQKDSVLEFFNDTEKNKDIPAFFFLVGENGSGKTSVLDFIYTTLGETKKGYAARVEMKNLKATVLLRGDTENINMNINIEEETIRSDYHPSGLKVIYDKVESNFKNPKVTKITALTADEEKNPREKSNDLSETIPQLLVNLKNQDANLVDDYIKAHGKIPTNFTRKLERFTSAFEKMFGDSKKFKTINPKNDEYQIIFTDKNNYEIDLGTFSTGEKQIIYRVGYLLKELENLDGAIILIDEPEISLHPKWQKKYVQFLMDVFAGLDIQFIIATHSPYILQGLRDGKSICYKINRANEQIGEKIGFYKNMIGGGPSLNLINYKVYDIADELLHIELFTALQVKEGGYDQLKKKLDTDSRVKKANSFVATVSFSIYKIGDTVTESLPVSIRNKMHHADEIARPSFNESSLRESIDIMLDILGQ